MFLRVEKLLNDEQLAVADKVLAAGTFVEGDTTAGPAAKRVKNNLQLDKGNPKAPRTWMPSFWARCRSIP
jgi:predicted 2-oxoglutarate/Fe(II)-dependent dioxygenase YbiX